MSTNEETQPEFEAGEKYKYRKKKGWAQFVTYAPDANDSNKAVFIDENGDVFTRYYSGGVHRRGLFAGDVIPEKYIEPFTPKIGVWLTKGKKQFVVIGFDPNDRSWPIIGFDHNGHLTRRSSKGCMCVRSKCPEDLDVYLHSLHEKYTDWDKFLIN